MNRVGGELEIGSLDRSVYLFKSENGEFVFYCFVLIFVFFCYYMRYRFKVLVVFFIGSDL